MTDFDIVHASDPRYRGGTASSIRGEIAGCCAWGLRTAILPFVGRRGVAASGFEPRLGAMLESHGIPLLSPDRPASCDILLAHHPHVFEFLPDRPVSLHAEMVALVLHHPLFDGRQERQYDLNRIVRNLGRIFYAPVRLAPISPVVRDQLIRAGVERSLILDHDLTNVIDLQDWPARDRPPPRHHAVIGRHSRNDPLKWPETSEQVLAAYPDMPTVEVRILGDRWLPPGMEVPQNWSVRPFQETGISEFLRGLDFFVYFHHRHWVEAFGIAIAEAMATGLVTILPPYLEPVFGDGAVYGQPSDVRDLIAHFMARPDEYARQSRAARRVVSDRYAIESYRKRMQDLFADAGLPLPASLPQIDRPGPVPEPERLSPLTRPTSKQRILMVAGNGIGLGHVTRLMAIAQHLPDWVEPMFLTLSLGSRLLQEAGFSADYIASHSKSCVTSGSWNEAFAVELLAALDASGARMVVFDGNDPFPGIVRVMDLRRDLAWVWIRRGMWQPQHILNAENAVRFDMIIEPGELAADEDGGATRSSGVVEKVGPVLLCNPTDRLPRQEAAARLGVNPAKRVVALQLGSGQNFDLASLRAELLRVLKTTDVQVIEIENPLAAPFPQTEGDPPRLRLFPLYPCTSVIDLLVTTAGYNAFHESVFGGIPTVFVPNQATEMDDQHLRARYAETAGLGLTLALADTPRAADVLARALTPDFAETVRTRAARLPVPDGAAAAARLVAEFLISVRTDRPLADRLPRP